jgi:hypothetical protein
MSVDDATLLVACYGEGWLTAQLLAAKDGIPYAIHHNATGTTREWSGRMWRYVATRRGLELTATSTRVRSTRFLSWAVVRRHSAAMSSAIRAELVAARDHFSETMRSCRIFKASPLAVGCGRPAEVGPLTRAQAAYAEEVRAWTRDVDEPFLTRMQAARDRLAAAVRAALATRKGTLP